MGHSTKAAWRTVLGGLSAAREYVPERAIVAGAQAKTFTVEQVPKAANAVRFIILWLSRDDNY